MLWRPGCQYGLIDIVSNLIWSYPLAGSFHATQEYTAESFGLCILNIVLCRLHGIYFMKIKFMLVLKFQSSSVELFLFWNKLFCSLVFSIANYLVSICSCQIGGLHGLFRFVIVNALLIFSFPHSSVTVTIWFILCCRISGSSCQKI